MRKWFLGVWVGLCAASPALQAQALWFTVSGNPLDESVDTVQVDPVAFKKTGDGAVMNIRVNRAKDRLNWDKLPYRSYEARVVFNCTARKADYAAITYYLQPVWKGEAHNTTDYSRNPRPMLFKDMVPNPTARIIQAACAAISEASPAKAAQ
ncbi:MAG: surface-adhesin E family protein [Pseudomonadota bacterium]